MQKKKQVKPIKQIIMFTILIILVLLLIFAEDIIKLSNKNKVAKNNLEASNLKYTTTIHNNTYDISKLIQDPKDIKPTLSAGMIPVKMDGEGWIISNKTPGDWYDYSEYKPAYMMLNDGVYQSEIVRNMEENGKKLASENIGTEIKQEELGTIYMWIPRLADDRNNFIYLKQECTPFGSYRTYNAFISKADKWDYSYAGVWVEYEPLASEAEVTTKVNNLNKGESDEIYGFLANTKAYNMELENYSLYSFIDRYIYSLSAKSMEYLNRFGAEETNVINNTNILKDLGLNNRYYRTVLRVSETNKLEPIKAESYFDTEKEQIIIEITHNKTKIEEVLFVNGEKLEFTTTNGKTVANTGSLEIGTGKYSITVIDIDGNAYQFNANGAPIYATLYTDGTLGISKGKTTISGKTPKVSYGDIQLSSNSPAWRNEATTIKTVNFVNKVQPISTANWFYNCTSLTTIYNIANLDTSKVTNMNAMFYGCSALTSLNVSNFDTSNVNYMNGMFYGCSALTSLDVSKFDTSKVTNMGYMFYGCSALTSLNVSNFDTSNVNYMNDMFQECSALTSLNVSNFDTSKVTNMSYMFKECYKLTSLDVSKWNTSNVTNMYGMFAGDDSNGNAFKYMSLETLDVSNFDTSNVISMADMFSCCDKLANIDVSKWNTSKAIDMNFMFNGCKSVKTLNVSNFDTSKVTNMRGMFQQCSGLTSLNLKSFNTAKVTNMEWMFGNCSRLGAIYVSSSTWVEPTTKTNMFRNCKVSSVTKQ